jgi:TFIIF-interacting CTD phosphatase-like protein
MSFSKDLSKLGRNLNKVIIIDNLSDNFKLQPNNGITIGTWTEDMRDTELIDIGNFLKNLVLKNPKDVRIVIQKINEDINRNVRKGNLNPFKDININDYV